MQKLFLMFFLFFYANALLALEKADTDNTITLKIQNYAASA